MITPRTRHVMLLRAPIAAAALLTIFLLGTRVSTSAADLQGQIDASRSSAASLQSAIAADSARIKQTAGGLQAARQQLASIQSELSAREAQLRQVQGALLNARDRLVELENRLQLASTALATNLRANYEGSQPDVVSVILESHGFTDLLERMSFLARIGHQDAHVVGITRSARAAVTRQTISLESLERRDRSLADEVLNKRNQAAALQAALLNQQISQLSTRAAASAKLSSLNSRLKSLEARAAAQAQQAAASGNASVGGIAVNTSGMVQPPSGAPSAVAQVIAAGNAIATLPYVYGGGHGSFHASGYDCSGSVSYALAAAGLLSSPLDSTGFESWGASGPGQWITVYANSGHAFMVVAGWRFDTVALAQGGTRWSHSMTDTSGYVARHPPGL